MHIVLRTLLLMPFILVTPYAWAHGDLRGGQGTIGIVAALAISVFPVLALISAGLFLIFRKKGAEPRRFWNSYFKAYGSLLLLVSISLFFVDYIEKLLPVLVNWFGLPLVLLSWAVGFSAPWWWQRRAGNA